MLFLAHDASDPFAAEVGKSFRRMFQKSWFFGCLCGRHRGRQVDQPLGIRCKAAHHFKSGQRVLLPHGDIVVEASCHNSLADHIVDIEQIVVDLLRGKRPEPICGSSAALFVGLEPDDVVGAVEGYEH